MTNDVSTSPLQSIRGPAIKDLSFVVPFAPFLARSSARLPPPPRKRIDWVPLPKGTLYPQLDDLVLESVQLPAPKSKYRPNRRPPPQIATHQPQDLSSPSGKWRKTVLSRHQGDDGQTSFIIGTKFGGIVNREPGQIPLADIFSHITPTELERFENQDFLEEEIIEASRPPPKPKGRPRKNAYSALLGAEDNTSREQSIASEGPVHVKKLRGRPKRYAVAVSIPSSPVTNHLSPQKPPLISVRVPSPIKPTHVVTNVPAFNGPRPTGRANGNPKVEPTAESSEDELSSQQLSGRPQYSMVKASGLAPSDTSENGETSRDVSISRAPSYDPILDNEPTPKRRKVSLEERGPLRRTSIGSQTNPDRDGIESTPKANNARGPTIIDLEDSDSNRSMGPSDVEDIDLIDVADVRDEEAEREALLRQFQSNNPQHSISPTTALSKPRARIRTPEPISLGSADQPHISPHALRKASALAKSILDQANIYTEDLCPIPSPSIKLTNPGKPHRRVSLTPHYPPGALFGYNGLDGSLDANAHASTAKTNGKSCESTDNATSTLESRRSSTKPTIDDPKLTLELHTRPKKGDSVLGKSNGKLTSSHKSRPRTHTPRQPEPTNDITKYFRPRLASKNPPPRPMSEGESDSEDPLTRASSQDSLGSKILHVRAPSRGNARVVDSDRNDSDNGNDSLTSEILTVEQRPQCKFTPYDQARKQAHNHSSIAMSSDSLAPEILTVGPRRYRKTPSPNSPYINPNDNTDSDNDSLRSSILIVEPHSHQTRLNQHFSHEKSRPYIPDSDPSQSSGEEDEEYEDASEGLQNASLTQAVVFKAGNEGRGCVNEG